jgi:hypothetical protein
MISNPLALDAHDPPPRARYMLRLLEDHVIGPIARVENVYIVTDGGPYRSPAIADAIDPAKRARDRSQHEDGEAADIGTADMIATFLRHQDDPIWQFIIYLREGRVRNLHVSIRSEREEVVRKRLVHWASSIDSRWINYAGQDLRGLLESSNG